MLSSVPLEPFLRAFVTGLCLTYVCGHIGTVKDRIRRFHRSDPSSRTSGKELTWPCILLVLDGLAFVISAGFFVYCLFTILTT
jgi:hypothetical protein